MHRRRKEKRLADESLRAALGIFEELGAEIWAGRCRAELGRVGLRPHAPDGLTETERQVAQLAAAGFSSRQIADRAFLAPKTVGNVLGRVYAKLDIHSRAELGAIMRDTAIAGSTEDDMAASDRDPVRPGRVPSAPRLAVPPGAAGPVAPPSAARVGAPSRTRAFVS